jgi:predicted regulator of Ras-like GTPase activity (Roadblock/LC7/MglB family)
VNDYKKKCGKELEHLVAREAHLDAALLCSVDGLPIAYACSKEIEADALSAMSSSMLSVGDALSIQGGDEGCIKVITQSENRTVALIHAGEEMLLVLMGGKALKLGMMLSHAKKEVEKILAIIASAKQKKQDEPEKTELNQLEELVRRVMLEAQERSSGKP